MTRVHCLMGGVAIGALLASYAHAGGQPASETTAAELQSIAGDVRPAIIASMDTFYGPITPEMAVCVGWRACENVTTGKRITVVGACAGRAITVESDVILVGDHTDIPKGASGFVNIGNRLCFWRTTGERTECPPPVVGCVPKSSDSAPGDYGNHTTLPK